MVASKLNPGPGSRFPQYDCVDIDEAGAHQQRRSGRAAKRKRRSNGGGSAGRLLRGGDVSDGGGEWSEGHEFPVLSIKGSRGGQFLVEWGGGWPDTWEKPSELEGNSAYDAYIADRSLQRK